MQYGKIKHEKSISPSSSLAVKEALSRAPHADLLRPDLEAAETTRRADLINEARQFFYTGMLSHEILERYPAETSWMAQRLADLEVVFRREQIQFVENVDKPAPKFSAPKPQRESAANHVCELPDIAIDKPHLKAVAINVEVTNTKTGEVTDEMVWFPRSQIKGGKVPSWLVGRKREELQSQFPKSSFSGLPE